VRHHRKEAETMQYFQGEFEERCHSTGAPNHLSLFTAIWSIIFLLLNIPGNLLVILAVVLDPYKNLRTPFNYLMASLACADLLVGSVTEPLSVYLHFKEGLDLNLHSFQTLHMTYFISCTASVLSLGTLAVERYLAIRNPHTYRNKLTGKRILGTIASIWGISVLLPLLYFEVGFITYAFIFANTALVVVFAITCFIYGLMLKKFYKRRMRNAEKSQSMARNSQLPQLRSMAHDSPVLRSQIRDRSVIQDSPDTRSWTQGQIQLRGCQVATESAPAATESSKNSQAMLKVRNSQRGQSQSENNPETRPQYRDQVTHVQGASRQSVLRGSQVTIESSPPTNAIYNSCQATERKITKMFLVVLVAMLSCYGPSTVLIYVMSFCETCQCNTLHWFRDLQFLFVIMNSSVNFYCYAIRSPRFRNAFKHILRLKRPENIQPATLRAVTPANLES
jgi:preprotein translocase subunit SecG